MATNAVLNVDKLLQVFLWVGQGEGEMVRTPSKNHISSVRGGTAFALEKKTGAQKDLAPDLTSRQGQDCDLSLDLQDAVCGLPIIRPVLAGLGTDTATFLRTKVMVSWPCFVIQHAGLSLGHCACSKPVSPIRPGAPRLQ